MKKILTLALVLFLSLSGIKTYSQNCDLIGGNLNTAPTLWTLNFQGIPVFATNSENITLRLPATAGIVTGDVMLFNVRCGVTYIWQTCGQVNYDTYMRLFAANLPNNPLLAENDDFCGLQSSLVWTAPFTGQVWVSVNEAPCQNAESPVGILTRAITPIIPAACPPNNFCSGAIPVTCGRSIGGTTRGATVDNVPGCGVSPFENPIRATAPGVWYSITGTGESFKASLCNTTNFDSKITVFEGTCNGPICVDGNDDFDGCGLSSEVTWCSEAGKTYLILVHGFGNASGQFILSVECVSPVSVSIDEPTSCASYLYGWSGADCVTLRASGSGGATPYSYSWSPSNMVQSGANSATACVAPNVSTTFTVTITDAYGCTDEATIQVDAVNIACGSMRGKEKVIMCHKANRPSAHEHCVNAADIEKNLAGKSVWTLGPCNLACTGTSEADPPCENLELAILTDDFGGEISFTLLDDNTGEAIISFPANTLPSNTLLTGTFCVNPNHCFTFTINDEFGDGICCVNGGIGGWAIAFQGDTIPSPTGGQYGAGESVTICGSGPTYVDPCPAGQVTLCHKPNKPSAHTHCVDQAKVASKLRNSDWALGPCPGGNKGTAAAASGEGSFEAFPNPFSGTTTLRFVMTHDSNVTLKVFSVTGAEVATLYKGAAVSEQSYEFTFDAKDLPAGIYFSKLISDSGEILVQKLIVQ